MSWVLVVLGFMVLVVLHELGHFAVAKAVGMRVEKFSLFFPPTIWSTTRGETEYAIGAIPAGGYVRITGMNPSEDLPPEVRDRAYHAQPVWKRMAVIAAGPLVNFVLAFLLLLAFYWGPGPQDSTRAIAKVNPGSPASHVLRPGDIVYAVDGKSGPPVVLSKRIRAHQCLGKATTPGCRAVTPAYISFRRNGQPHTVAIRPRYDKVEKRPLIGFLYAQTRLDYSFGKAFKESADAFWYVTRETVKLPARIFDAKKRKEISGIVGTSDATHKAISDSIANGIFLFAVISLSLAIINLFPFLPLDGGHIFWAGVEFARRRPVPYAVMERAGVLGFMLVIGLFLLGLSNDIGRLTSGTNVP